MRRKEPIQVFSVHEVTASDLPLFFMQEFAKPWSFKSFFFFNFFFLGAQMRKKFIAKIEASSLIHKSVSVDCGGEVA